MGHIRFNLVCIDIGLKYDSNFNRNTRWIQNGVTVAGGNREGSGANQLSYPYGLYVDDDQTIYVADYGNHRVMEWKYGTTSGQVVAGGIGRGQQKNHLNYPTDVILDKEKKCLITSDSDNRRLVQWSRSNGSMKKITLTNVECCRIAMDNNGYFYTSDPKKDEIRRWKVGDIIGTLVAGGNERDNGFHQLNWPMNVFVDSEYSVYVSDFNNHRVMKWTEDAQEGSIVAGGQGLGNDLGQLFYPQGLVVDHLGSVYVADRDNHRIMRWPKGAIQGEIIVGGNGDGKQADQLFWPQNLAFDRQGNLYVADCMNHRIQRFDIDQN
jgi:sugar lactone lactonase YvrE